MQSPASVSQTGSPPESMGFIPSVEQFVPELPNITTWLFFQKM